jgi:peroxiredoxin Q/BCP
MVSLDAPEKNREFAASLKAKLTLLSDPEGVAAKAYGVLEPDGTYALRWTFFIGADGAIRRIDKDVSPSTYGSDLASALRELGFEEK